MSGVGPYVLAVDEGSSTARAVVVDAEGAIVAEARRPVLPIHDNPGWVEIDPVRLWELQLAAICEAFHASGIRVDELAAVGLTTHRETAVVWDRATGRPLHHAIMWMSSQTDEIVHQWSADGLDDKVRRSTGLHNDSYYTAAKIAWILRHVDGAQDRARRGELAAGTVDTWLLWNLTGGRSHLTDHTEASRTAMFDLETLDWDHELLAAYDIPVELLATPVASDAGFGELLPEILGAAVPITAVLGDQQASMYGQGCFTPGSAKNTYGTAGVLTVSCGTEPRPIDGLTTGVSWTLRGETRYGVEGVVAHCGQALQWLRDRFGTAWVGANADRALDLVADTDGVYMVPAFAGLWAPALDRRARGGLVGLSLATTVEHMLRAAIESMAYQTLDIVDALRAGDLDLTELRVDGGGARSDALCQFQADLLGIPLARSAQLERTALGIAFAAGASSGLWAGEADVASTWSQDRVFEPSMDGARRDELVDGWRSALASVRAHTPGPRRSGTPHPERNPA
ncbi:MAG: glycerol kinase GlpK [Nocardioidaceae bacterium]|nr:glycerol kinase GlpK [Nocardioidaceae bacterium]